MFAQFIDNVDATIGNQTENVQFVSGPDVQGIAVVSIIRGSDHYFAMARVIP